MPVPPVREVPGADEQGTSEKALAVDANVNIKLPCISNAKLSINGWSRNEIRVFIKNGSSFNFRVHEKDPKTGKPVWVLIANAAGNGSGPPVSECLSGDKIEIDAPINAGLTISGREGETVVDSVKKVFIKSLGGDVSLRNEARIVVAEVLAQRLDALPGIQENRRVEVPEGMHAVPWAERRAGLGEGRAPDVTVEPVPVQALPLAVGEQELRRTRRTVHAAPGQGHADGGVRGNVGLHGTGDGRGQRNSPGLATLRKGEDRPVPDEPDLPDDVDHPFGEVDVVDGQA